MTLLATTLAIILVVSLIYFCICTFGGSSKPGTLMYRLHVLLTTCSPNKTLYKDRKGFARFITKLNLYFNETNHHVIMVFYYLLWIASSYSVYYSFVREVTLILPEEDNRTWKRVTTGYSYYKNLLLNRESLPNGYHNGLLPVWCQIMTYVLHLLSIISFTMASFLDPGTYKPADDKKELDKYVKYPIDNVCYREEKHCSTCDHVRPIRCKHCSVTNRDVMKLDHFCPWVVNTIGEKNIFHFNMFLLSTSIALINKGIQDFIVLFFNATTPIDFIDAVRQHKIKFSFLFKWSLLSSPVTFLSMFLHVIVGVMLLFFAGYHFSLMISNKTTAYEFKIEDIVEDISDGKEVLIRKVLTEEAESSILKDSSDNSNSKTPFHDGLFLIPTRNIVSGIKTDDGKKLTVKEIVTTNKPIHGVNFSYREFNNEKNIIFSPNTIILDYMTAIKLVRRRNVYSFGVIGNLKEAMKAAFTNMRLSQYPNHVPTAEDFYQEEIKREAEIERRRLEKKKDIPQKK